MSRKRTRVHKQGHYKPSPKHYTMDMINIHHSTTNTHESVSASTKEISKSRAEDTKNRISLTTSAPLPRNTRMFAVLADMLQTLSCSSTVTHVTSSINTRATEDSSEQTYGRCPLFHHFFATCTDVHNSQSPSFNSNTPLPPPPTYS